VYADTSGVARTAVFSAWQSAAVSAGGLVGPALTAMLFFMMARGPRGARAALVLTGVTLLAVDALLVRNLFGGVFIGFVALVSLLIAWKAPHASQLTVVFVAVQLALSVFSRGDYLFTPVANMAAGDMPSDVANIASVLILPYWVWGALCGLISIVALLLGVASFLRLSRR
ncbi:MAG TPA: M50 family metallopeptidase, partial [Candidatus Limnocylindrales bacterium]|nr:M50 family metallopeptidase [Candidatus Limnocylindrales bacterium]